MAVQKARGQAGSARETTVGTLIEDGKEMRESCDAYLISFGLAPGEIWKSMGDTRNQLHHCVPVFPNSYFHTSSVEESRSVRVPQLVAIGWPPRSPYSSFRGLSSCGNRSMTGETRKTFPSGLQTAH